VSICSVRLRKAIPSLIKLSLQVNQFRERATQPIEAPDDEDIAGSQMVECGSQLGTVRFCARERVGEDALTAGRLQRVTLERESLVEGGNASVADLHSPNIVSQPISKDKRRGMIKQHVHDRRSMARRSVPQVVHSSVGVAPASSVTPPQRTRSGVRCSPRPVP
jgi:hypothetical protein